MTGKIEVRSKRQITLPKALANSLKIAEGDILEYQVHDGRIIITPKMLVPKDQSWYWSKEWQQAEAEVAAEIAAQGYGKDLTVDQLLEELDNAQD